MYGIMVENRKGNMAVKKFTEYTIKSKFYLPTQETAEATIEIIMKGIEGLGGNPKDC